jgi:hypothetical protein
MCNNGKSKHENQLYACSTLAQGNYFDFFPNHVQKNIGWNLLGKKISSIIYIVYINVYKLLRIWLWKYILNIFKYF